MNPVIAWIFGIFVVVVLYANSKKEFEYQERVLKDIIAETGGEIPSVMESGIMKSITSFVDLLFLIGNDTHLAAHSGGFVINAMVRVEL